LRDLYGFSGAVDENNWKQLDAMIRERADDRTWHRDVARRARIQRFATEHARRGHGEDDDILQYSLEWAFFTRCQWGEFDTALFELERCWGRNPESPTAIGTGPRPSPDRVITSLEDVHTAMSWYVDHIPRDVLSMATHISTDIDLRPVSDAEMASALKSRAHAGAAERNIYASYVNELLLNTLEKRRPDVVFQFSFGAEPLPFETASRLSQRTVAQVAAMISRHPKIRFQCFLSSAHSNQSMCTLCRELPNLSLAGYWWHNFFPSIIRRVMAERLDMLPTNKQIGFFSDAYCVEWAYAKAAIVRTELARVLADNVVDGRYEAEEACEIARAILFDSPQSLLGMTPSDSLRG